MVRIAVRTLTLNVYKGTLCVYVFVIYSVCLSYSVRDCVNVIIQYNSTVW